MLPAVLDQGSHFFMCSELCLVDYPGGVTGRIRSQDTCCVGLYELVGC